MQSLNNVFSSRQHRLLDLSVIILFCSILFGLFLGSRPLNVPDEGRYPNIAREMLVTHQYITPKLNGVPFLDKPPLYYWLEAASMKLFGINKWAIRLPQALFGLLGCLLVYGFGRRFYSRKVGLLAAILMAVSPLYYFTARYANMDLEIAIWITASLMCFYRFYDSLKYRASPHNYWIYLSAVCAGFGMLTKGLIGLALPALVIFIFLLLQKDLSTLKRLKWIPCIAIVLIICLPWYWAVQAQNPSFFHYFFIYQQFDRFTGGGFNNQMPVYFYLGILLSGFAPWTFFTLPILRHIVRLRYPYHLPPHTYFLAVWSIVITVFFSIPQSKIISYILPMTPAFMLLIAQGIKKHEANWRLSHKITTGIWNLLALLAGIVLWVLPGHTPKFPMELSVFFWPLGSLFIITALLATWLSHQNKVRKLVCIWIVTMIIFNTVAMSIIPYFDHKPAYKLAQQTKPLIKPNTTLISYGGFYEDLPIYFNRRFKIVYHWHNPNIIDHDNWARDLYEGLKDTPTQAVHWLISPSTFRKIWQTTPSVMVFTSQYYFNILKKTLKPTPKLIAEVNGKVAFIRPQSKITK